MPELNRRELLVGAAALGLAGCGSSSKPAAGEPELYELAPGLHHFATFLLSPHPRPVREAIERHRRAMDADPSGYYYANEVPLEARAAQAAGKFLGVEAEEVALTDSTTMGLGLLYGGLKLRPGQHFLTTRHDHFATHGALALTGRPVRRVALYRDPAQATVAGMVRAVRRALEGGTRVLAVTWVHSVDGVRTPVAEFAELVAAHNRGRRARDRTLLCVDGVHGFGAEADRVGDLGCDFFAAGCHKWLSGPRGTGVLWGRRWGAVTPTIPSFTPGDGPGARHTPGGFHSFEHRWALADAFALREQQGPAQVAERIHALARRLKEGLAGVKGVRLITPMAGAVSSGLVCVDVDGRDPADVVRRLADEHDVIATVTPYAQRYVRFGTHITADEADVDAAIAAMRAVSA
jgi:selenocysteine lyase/cysteine desulfurase